jgi:hypothetical protein
VDHTAAPNRGWGQPSAASMSSMTCSDGRVVAEGRRPTWSPPTWSAGCTVEAVVLSDPVAGTPVVCPVRPVPQSGRTAVASPA